MKNTNSVNNDGSPLVSIIIPVYNIKDYLTQCIDSVLAQTYKNIEIILVDDHSTDGSSEICEKYIEYDSRITVIHKSSNEGLVCARKSGMRKATGEFIATIDGDDWVDQLMVEDMMNQLMTYKSDFVQCGFRCCDHHYCKEVTFKDIDYQEVKYPFKEIESWIGKKEPKIESQIFTKIYKTGIFCDAYDKVPDDMNNGEDFVFFVELMNSVKSYSSISRCYYNYRVRNESLSHHRSFKRIINECYLMYYLANRIPILYPEISGDLLDEWQKKKIIRITEPILQECYSNLAYIPSYTFPCISELQNKKIAIYGAGVIGQEFYTQISRYHNIYVSAWVDKRADGISNPYMQIDPIEVLLDTDYDLICVTIKKEQVVADVFSELRQLGISDEKMKWAMPQTIHI